MTEVQTWYERHYGQKNPSFDNIAGYLRGENRGIAVLQAHYTKWDVNAIPCKGPFMFTDCFSMVASYLLWACYLGDLQIAKVLLELGANAKAKSEDGRTALMLVLHGYDSGGHYARYSDRQKLMRLLLQQPGIRAAINDTDKDSWTALHYAAYENLVSMAHIILSYGADATKCMPDGRTAEDFAYDCFHDDMGHVIFRYTWVLEIGEWRPRKHAQFPVVNRVALRTLCVLAKAHKVDEKDAALFHSNYESACLDCLPEELLQYLFVFVTSVLIPDKWIA